jgi:hypothetical protein
VAFLVRGRSRSGLFAATAAFALAAMATETRPAEVQSQTPSAAASPTSGYRIERVGNGIKLVAQGQESSYAITVLGSNSETAVANLPADEAWQRSLGVRVEGTLGGLLKTDLSTRFTEAGRTFDAGPFGPQTASLIGADRRALEELNFSTKFLGDRVSVGATRRGSSHVSLGRRIQSEAEYAQDRFDVALWKSERSSVSVEGLSTHVDAGFQAPGQAAQSRTEETRQLKTKLGWRRAGVFVNQRDAVALASDRGSVVSHQSDVETGATISLSDLRQSPVLYILPDSVWLTTNRGSIAGSAGPAAAETKAVEKSAVGVARKWSSGSVNLSYWRSSIDETEAASKNAQWRGSGVDAAGTLKSGRVAVSGTVSWFGAESRAAWSKEDSTINGSLQLTWSPSAWPKVSAGVSNYAFQSAFLDRAGFEENRMVRYDLAVDSTPLLSAWSDPAAQLKFIASYQGNSTNTLLPKPGNAAASTQNVFVGVKFKRSLLP